MDKAISYAKKVPLFLALLAITISMISLRALRTYVILPEAALRLSLAVLMAGFLYLISGTKTFVKCFRQTYYVVKTLSAVLFYAALLGIAQFYIYYSSDKWNFAEGWPLELACCAVLMFSVGLFEELLFRAVVCDALIYQFRNFMGVFILTGIVVPFVFGCMHIVGSPIHTPLMLLQAVLKAMSTGIIGFSLLMMYWKTRDVLACAIVHALFDFLPTAPAVLYGEWSLLQVGNYVLEGDVGLAVVGVLLFDLVIELCIMVFVWKKVMKTIDFEEMRREW